MSRLRRSFETICRNDACILALCGWRLRSHTDLEKGGVAADCAERAVGCLHCVSRLAWFAIET